MFLRWQRSDADFPVNSVYSFVVKAAPLGKQTATLAPPATDIFPNAPPIFTGEVFSQLQGMNTALPLQLTWNGFTPAADTTSNWIGFTIFRTADGQDSGFGHSQRNEQFHLVTAAGAYASTEHAIPTLCLELGNQFSAANAGFGTAGATVRIRPTNGPGLYDGGCT